MTTETLPDLLRFVWLSRGDLPAAMDPATTEGRRAFLLWWAFHGRHEFPLVAPLIAPDTFAELLLPAADGVPPLAAALWEQRQDLHERFEKNDPGLTAWLVVHGFDEIGLWPLVGPRVGAWAAEADTAGLPRLVRLLAMLRPELATMDDSQLLWWWLDTGRHAFPALAAVLPPDAHDPAFLPAANGIPPLAAALWQQRPDLQVDFAVDDPRLAAWLVVHGLGEHRLRSLIGARVQAWLAEADAAGLPRLVRLLALLRPELAAMDDGQLLWWWLKTGRHELPALTALLPPDAHDPAFLPAANGVPPLATALWQRRPDLQVDYGIDDPRLAAWLFVHGLDEYGFWPLTGPRVRDWIAETDAAGVPRLVRFIAMLRPALAAMDDGQLLWWWLKTGRHDVPALAAHLPPDAHERAFLPAANGVPPLAAALRSQRPDLQAAYSVDDPRLTAWLVVHGIGEHDLWSLIGPRVQAWASEPEPAGTLRLLHLVAALRPELAGLDDDARRDWFLFHGLREHQLVPLLTAAARAALGLRFMEAMQSARPDVPADLADGVASDWWPAPPESGAPLCHALLADPRRGLVAWCLTFGLAEYGLEGLVGAEDRDFLAAPADAAPPPAVVLAWYARADLRAEYELSTPEGRTGLVRWYRDQAHHELPLAAALLEQQPAPAAPAVVKRRRPHGVNLVGFAHGELGIGEDVRCMAQALASAAIPHTIINLDTRSNCRAGDRSLDGRIGDCPLYDTNIFCLTGFDTVWAYIKLGPDFFANAMNIGNWPWELPRWPEKWGFALDLADEVWGISRFCTECYGAATAKPVLWMPSAVRPATPAPLTRADLGLPAGRFVFTVVFDFNSYIERKNPLAALDAFERAFGLGGAPVLAVKVMNADAGDLRWRAFRQRAAVNPSVVLLEGTWPYEQTLALVAASDCILSLHRAEGLGRSVAEAMTLGVPVIATGWSGSTDLTADDRAFEVDYDLVPVPAGAYPCADGQVWAEPSIDHAVRRMREVVGNVDEARARAERARTHVLANHSAEAAGQRYRRRLQELWARR